MTYAEWIANYVARSGSLFGKCWKASRDMQRVFPELEQVYGWVNCEHHAKWPHWYLRAADGSVVDPSASQFTRINGYGEFELGEPELTGRCPDCQAFVYDYAECCVLAPA